MVFRAGYNNLSDAALRNDKEIFDLFKKANTKSEFKTALQPIRNIFDGEEFAQQIDEWAAHLEQLIFVNDASPGLKIIDQRAKDNKDEIIDALEQKTRNLEEKIDAIPGFVDFSLNPIESSGKMLQKHLSRAPINAIRYDLSTGERRFEFSEEVGFTIKVGGEQRKSLERFIRERVPTVLDLSDPNLEITSSHPSLDNIFGFTQQKEGLLKLEQLPAPTVHSLKYRTGGNIFQILTRIVVDPGNRTIAYEAGFERGAWFKMEFTDKLAHWKFHIGNPSETDFDDRDLPFLKFLLIFSRTKSFALQHPSGEWVSFPLNGKTTLFDGLEESRNLVEFVILLLEVNRLLLALEVITEPLAKPNPTDDDIDALSHMFQMVKKVSKDRKYMQPFSTPLPIDTTNLSSEQLASFSIENGKLMGNITLRRALTIGGQVRFIEVIKMKNPSAEFWTMKHKLNTDSLEKAMKMAEDNLFLLLFHKRAKIAYEPFVEPEQGGG